VKARVSDGDDGGGEIGHLTCMVSLIGWSSHRGCISFCFAHHLLSELTEYLLQTLLFHIISRPPYSS